MSLSINTNLSALRNQRSLNNKSSALGENFAKLSSGKRINKASDDSAGLAIAMAMYADMASGSVASRNISDGVSAANIAEGAMDSASGIVTRMNELSTQAANGTLSDDQRSALNNEYQQLGAELDRISETTTFNGQQLLSGDSITIQAGTDASADSQLTINNPDISAAGLGLAADISTQSNALAAIDSAKTATENLASARGELGGTVNRLSTAYENLQTRRLGEAEATSRIMDADIAKETAGLAANRIGQQMAAALAGQANMQPSLALKLLS